MCIQSAAAAATAAFAALRLSILLLFSLQQ